MKTDLYSFAFRGQLAEEALDKAGRKKYSNEEAFFSGIFSVSFVCTAIF